MVYGIGTKALSEQLDVVEEEAAVFMQDFREAYPDVKRSVWTSGTIVKFIN